MISTMMQMIILIAGTVLVTGVTTRLFAKAEGKTAEEICRATVAIREHAKINLKLANIDISADKLSPLICQSQEKDVPGTNLEGKALPVTKENVIAGLEKLTASCWWQFGEGKVADVFEGSMYNTKCFICYYTTIQDGPKFSKKNGDKIASLDLYKSMLKDKKMIATRNDKCFNFGQYFGGQCIPDNCDCKQPNGCREDSDYTGALQKEAGTGNCDRFRDESLKSGTKAEDAKFKCCIGSTSCENKGGVCKADCSSSDFPDNTLELNEPGYVCDKNEKCCLKENEYLTYMEYVRGYGGEGRIFIISDIEPEGTYAIAMASPSSDPGAAQWISNTLGFTTGAGAAVTGLAIGAGVAVTWPVVVVGVAAGVGVALLMDKWGAPEGYAYNYALYKRSMSPEDVQKIMKYRDMNTIFIGELSEINKYCEVQKDAKGN